MKKAFMPSSVHTYSDITPAWLTALLTQHSCLSAGQVLHVEQKLDPNQNATLLLTYSPDAQGVCPRRLFFKQGPRTAEARFYQNIAPLLTHPMAPICYDAQYDTTSSHILVAYVEQTHFAAAEALPMSLAYHEMTIDALADLHSQFWDQPRLQPEIGVLASDVPQFAFTIYLSQPVPATHTDHKRVPFPERSSHGSCRRLSRLCLCR